jgi:hypothetical protein
MKKFLSLILTVLISFTTLFFTWTSAIAQVSGPNDAEVQGRILLVSKDNNTLIVKLQARAIHPDPDTLLILPKASLWFSYNKNVVSLAEQPVAASDSVILDGDFYYRKLNSPYYTQKRLTREPIWNASANDTIMYALTHFVWQGWDLDDFGAPKIAPSGHLETLGPAEEINEWTDIDFIKFDILKTDTVKLRWNKLMMANEILDIDQNSYTLGPFADLIIPVTHHTPDLTLSSTVICTGASSSLNVYVKTTDSNTRTAGTAGFYIYYNSAEATVEDATDFLNLAPFGWTNASITDESISTVSKNMIQYDHRIKITSSDGSQGNDNWQPINVPGRKALSVKFTPYTSDGIYTHLEVINRFAFRNYDESVAYPVAVLNPSQLICGPDAKSNDPLPVTLVDFSGSRLPNRQVLLHWETALEIENDKFIVERSANGKNFEEIGMIRGKGTTTDYQHYSFTDPKALSGISYYRLKQTDFNGKTTYTSVVTIKQTDQEALLIANIYPNPFSGATNIAFGMSQAETVTLLITDILGNTIRRETLETKAGANELELKDLQNLRRGIYTLQIKTSQGQISGKLLKE